MSSGDSSSRTSEPVAPELHVLLGDQRHAHQGPFAACRAQIDTKSSMEYVERMTPETFFTRMVDATSEDFAVIARHALGFQQGLPDRILHHLALLAGDTGGYAVDRLTHSLQTATRALRDGRDEEYVACALVHDIGDTLASLNHSELAAVIVEPFVSEANHWIVKHHGIFQGYYFFHHLGLERNMRDRYRDHPHWRACADFCANYDQNSFDPGYATEPLESFAPLVRRVFAAPKRSIYLPNEG